MCVPPELVRSLRLDIDKLERRIPSFYLLLASEAESLALVMHKRSWRLPVISIGPGVRIRNIIHGGVMR